MKIIIYSEACYNQADACTSSFANLPELVNSYKGKARPRFTIGVDTILKPRGNLYVPSSGGCMDRAHGDRNHPPQF